MTTGRRTRSEVADEAMEVALRVGATTNATFFKESPGSHKSPGITLVIHVRENAHADGQ